MLLASNSAGAEAPNFYLVSSARLKSCPVTKRVYEMKSQSSLLNVSRLLKLNSVPTSVESPAEPVLLAMPPRLKLAPANVETSVPTVAGSI